MIKKVQLYRDKYIDVDTDKIKGYIFNFFCVILFTLFIIIPDYQFSPFSLTVKSISIISIATLFFMLLLCVKIYEKSLKLDKLDVFLLIYTFFIVLSCIFSKYKTNVILGVYGRSEGLLTLLSYMMTFYIFKELFKYNKKIFNLLTVSLIIVSCYGIYQTFGDKVLGMPTSHTAFGTISNSNMFSSFLTLFLPIYIVKYFKSNSKINLLVSSVIFAALVCSKTSGGYITFAIYFIVLCIYSLITSDNKKKAWLKIAVILFTFSAIFLLLNVISSNGYSNEIMQNRKGSEQYQEMGFANGRLTIWKLTLDVLKHNPIFGVGPDSLGQEILFNYMLRPDYPLGNILVDRAHCEYLHIAVTTGIPSAIVYIAFVTYIAITLLIKYINTVKEKGVNSKEAIFIVAIAASVASYLFQAGANISDPGVAPFFFAMLGICVKTFKNDNKNS